MRFTTKALVVALLDLRNNPPLSLIFTFLSGLFLLGVLVNYVYDLIMMFESIPSIQHVRLLYFVIGTIIIAFISFSYYIYTSVVPRLNLQTKISPVCSEVITSLSPYLKRGDDSSNLDPIIDLIQYHTDKLERLTIICNLEQNGVQIAREKLNHWLQDTETLANIDVIYLNIDDSYSFVEVSRIADQYIKKINSKRIAVDFTVGTKQISTGLLLAALANNKFPTYGNLTSGEDGKLVTSREVVIANRDTLQMLLSSD